MFGVPLRMHLLEENTILSPLWMITLCGMGVNSRYLCGVEKENGVANRQKDKDSQVR